jgi:hypothetical protein
MSIIKEFTQEQKLSVRAMLIAICEYYQVSENEVLNLKTRERRIVELRQITQYILYKTTTLNLSRIGSIFKHKFDHATVLHSVNKWSNHTALYPNTKEYIGQIKELYSNTLVRIKENKESPVFTFIDLNNVTTMIYEGKSIILKDFEKEEIEKIKEAFPKMDFETKEHEETGLKFYSYNANKKNK